MKTISVILLTLFVIVSILASCVEQEALHIQKVYAFKVAHLPIPSSIVKDEMVEIRCTLEKDGDYKDTNYSIRFFQNKGKGTLFLEDKQLDVPNDLYPLRDSAFRLYYLSQSKETHQFDVYVEDNFGQSEKLSFEFSDASAN